ncbi:PRC-barrel domain-containing protein [Jannaschia sp. LMIT008]|uniref:PRC-barrel domain-containing protein n=1 Tax=Jannaschia maritima TaxID=3032585 RepID=UPI0028124934|nr:PRC-barrel domain-containing protein [Jannaschia sp. LMIT008]
MPHHALRTATLALTLSLPAAALADAHAADPFAPVDLQYGESYLATTLIGTRVHVTEDTLDPRTPYPAGTVAEWDDIGEIGDLIVGVDGSLQAVVIDVGGFLGLGEKEVAVQWSSLVGVREDDDPQEYFLGMNATQAMLEAAPELERTPVD